MYTISQTLIHVVFLFVLAGTDTTDYLQRVFCGVFLSAIYLMDILDVGEYGQVMIEGIKMVGELGVQGVAIGVLTEDNKINVEQVLKKTSLLLLALKSEFCQVFYRQTHGKLCGGMGFG